MAVRRCVLTYIEKSKAQGGEMEQNDFCRRTLGLLCCVLITVIFLRSTSLWKNDLPRKYWFFLEVCLLKKKKFRGEWGGWLNQKSEVRKQSVVGKRGCFPLHGTDQEGILMQTLCCQSSLVFSSVQFSHSVVSASLRPHESQHARPPCPSPTPGVHPNSCALSQWCHPTISSSVVPFSSCPESRPASGSFPVSQLSAWGGQSTGVSASASVLPMKTQDWSPLGWTG